MRKILDRSEKESVVVTDVSGLHGQKFKKVVMVISEGKLFALKDALENNSEFSAVANDLFGMFVRAET